MKKYLFAAAVLAAVAAPAAQAKTLQQIRSEFINACIQFAASEQISITPQQAGALCTCTFDETGKQYGARWKSTLEAFDQTGNDPQFSERLGNNAKVCSERIFKYR